MVGGLRDVITCAEFQIEIFMGYDFTGSRIFDFPIDFSMGFTTVQRYCAACDDIKTYKKITWQNFNKNILETELLNLSNHGVPDFVSWLTHGISLDGIPFAICEPAAKPRHVAAKPSAAADVMSRPPS